ncbi:MAG: MAPEG family protein [Deltaproteobacteria bacterium]|nr:MAPEG family protein [Deltaproteobacteria bacterium]
MSDALLYLLLFVAWTALLVVAIAAMRVAAVLKGEKRSNEFPADEPHGGPFYRRLWRAHLNCVENLPLFATVVLVAEVSGQHTSGLDAFAGIYLAARVLQTSFHLISLAPVIVNARFTMFMVQVVALVLMIADVLMA